MALSYMLIAFICKISYYAYMLGHSSSTFYFGIVSSAIVKHEILRLKFHWIFLKTWAKYETSMQVIIYYKFFVETI